MCIYMHVCVYVAVYMYVQLHYIQHDDKILYMSMHIHITVQSYSILIDSSYKIVKPNLYRIHRTHIIHICMHT